MARTSVQSWYARSRIGAGGGRDRHRLLRRDLGEPACQDIPAERCLNGKRTRDRCHHRDADEYPMLYHRHG
jgi:hypothetical protein